MRWEWIPALCDFDEVGVIVMPDWVIESNSISEIDRCGWAWITANDVEYYARTRAPCIMYSVLIFPALRGIDFKIK